MPITTLPPWLDVAVDRVLAAHASVHAPTAIDAAHLLNIGMLVVIAWALIAAAHVVVVGCRIKRAYYALHVLANIVICAYTWGPATDALLNPATSTLAPSAGPASSQMFMVWVYAIHIYHPIMFRTNAMDWIHHVPVYILNTLMFSCLAGNIFALQVRGCGGGGHRRGDAA
jgi:hypothetical protein